MIDLVFYKRDGSLKECEFGFIRRRFKKNIFKGYYEEIFELVFEERKDGNK